MAVDIRARPRLLALLGAALLVSACGSVAQPAPTPSPLSYVTLPQPLAVSVPRPAAIFTPTAAPANPAVGPAVPDQAVAAAAPALSSLPHILVIMEENKGYAATLGSCSADPFLCSLAAAGWSAPDWYAVAHPSAPNYLALLSGSTQGITSDCVPPSCGPYSATDLGGELSAAGIPWVAYMESMPSPCFRGSSVGLYAEKHDPFMSFDDELGSGCTEHVVPYPGVSSMLATLDGPSPPDFVWITPNLDDDMHNGTVQEGDAWLRATLPSVFASPWFRDNGTVVVTMDENDSQPTGLCCGLRSGGGQIPLVVVASRPARDLSLSTTGDLFGLLRSLEEAYGVPLLGAAASPDSGDISSLLR